MDPNQILGIAADTFNSLDPKSKEALTYPSARTLGNAADGLISLVFYPLLKAQIFTHEKLKQYRKEVSEKISHIPENNRDISKFGLVLKAIEESRYQLNEDDIRKMYVNLISSTVDNRKNNFVNPRIASVVAQFGIKEAELLKMLFHSKNHTILNCELYAYDSSGDFKNSPTVLYYDGVFFKDYGPSIDILKSLGVIDFPYKRKLVGQENNYFLIQNYLKTLAPLYKLSDSDHDEFRDGYIEYTNFGEQLAHCIFE